MLILLKYGTVLCCISHESYWHVFYTDNFVEMAKLYGNRSAAYYQQALNHDTEKDDDDETKAEFLQHALEDGLKSVELSSSYEKGHFRLVLCCSVGVNLRRNGRVRLSADKLTN